MARSRSTAEWLNRLMDARKRCIAIAVIDNEKGPIYSGAAQACVSLTLCSTSGVVASVPAPRRGRTGLRRPNRPVARGPRSSVRQGHLEYPPGPKFTYMTAWGRRPPPAVPRLRQPPYSFTTRNMTIRKLRQSSRRGNWVKFVETVTMNLADDPPHSPVSEAGPTPPDRIVSDVRQFRWWHPATAARRVGEGDILPTVLVNAAISSTFM